MFALLRPDTSPGDSRSVLDLIESCGGEPRALVIDGRDVVAWSGGDSSRIAEGLSAHAGVEQVMAFKATLPFAEGDGASGRRVVQVGDVSIGGDEVVVIAGPCAIETRERTLDVAAHVSGAGARLLRGGAYKPRTTPYRFQGLGGEGLEILEEARAASGLGVVTEALDVETIDAVVEVADMVQVGARNMQNFGLLKRLATCGRPVLLKRGMAATVDEWLGAAEYLLAGGNPDVVLCERGIRTFAGHARNTLDLGVIDAIRERTNLPIIVDPSHAAGDRDRVPSLARAALAAGADGLIVEVHPDPTKALSDGPQALRPEAFARLMEQLRAIAPIVGRRLASAAERTEQEVIVR